MVDTVVDELVRQLREKLLTCDATKETTLWRQLASRHKAVDALLTAILEPNEDPLTEQHSADSRCDRLLSVDALPTVLTSLLSRLCATAAPSLCTLPDSHLEALYTLLWGLRCAVMRAVSILSNQPAACQAERFLCAVAAAQPCAALAAVMALLSSAAAQSPAYSSNTQSTVLTFRRLSICAANIALQLSSATVASLRIASTLARDRGAARLLLCAGDTALGVLSLPVVEATSPDTIASVCCLAQALAPRSKLPAGSGGRQAAGTSSSSSSSPAAFQESPRVASVLMSAVITWRWGEQDGGLGTWAAEALTAWLHAQQEQAPPPEGEREWPADELTANVLIAAVPGAADIGAATMAEAGGNICGAHRVACGLLSALLSCVLPPTVRHGAFPAVAAYATRVADMLLRDAAVAAAAGGAAAAAAAAVQGGGGALDGSVSVSGGSDCGDSGKLAELVIHIMNVSSGHFELEDILSGNAPDMQPEDMRLFRARARWCTRRRLVGKCEALLRLGCGGGSGGAGGGSGGGGGGGGGGGSGTAGRWPPALLQEAVASASQLAARTHAVLLWDEEDSAAAQAAHESLLATVCKITQTPAPGNSGSQAGVVGGSAGGTAGGTEAWPSLKWLDTLGPAIQAFYDAAVPMQLPPGAADAPLYQAAMQLLPPAVRRATAFFSPGRFANTNQIMDAVTLLGRLPFLHHHAGLADVTAAAGVPALLDRALRMVAGASSTASLHPIRATLPVLVLAVLHTAGNNAGWLRAAGRLELVAQAQACANLVPPSGVTGLHPMVQFLRPAPPELRFEGVADLETAMLFTAIQLTADIEAFMAGAAGHFRTPSWDDCLLSSLAPPDSTCPDAAEEAAGPPFFGCCRRHCSNLSGVTETALCLRMCGGCRLARYCSEACQRRAWRTGHRRACQAWQLTDGRHEAALADPALQAAPACAS